MSLLYRHHWTLTPVQSKLALAGCAHETENLSRSQMYNDAVSVAESSTAEAKRYSDSEFQKFKG